MLSNFKIYLIGGLALVASVFAYLFKSEQLKLKKQELKTAKKTAQINHDVAKILASRNVNEVIKRVNKEISNGDLSSLDD